MWINVKSIKGSIIDLKTKRVKITEQVKYIAAMLTFIGAILINALTLKLNISMCSGENYKQVSTAIKN